MPGHCAAMAVMRDLDEIYEHMSGFCHDCIDAQLEQAANGEELLFTDGPPSWIAAQEAREAEERAEQQRQEEMERKRKAIEKKREKEGGAKVNWTSAEEAKREEIRKLAGQISDRHLEQEIKKLMRVDGAEAAQMRLELKREMALKRREKEKDEEKVEVKQQIKNQKQEQKKNPEGPTEMNKFQILAQKRPWQPHLPKAIAIGDERRSELTVEEQKRYVAILSNFHQIESKLRFEQNKKDLKIYDERLMAEREVMDGMVRDHLKEVNVSMSEVSKEIDNVLKRWCSRYLNDQRRFERVKEIQWRREAEIPPTHGVLKPILERVLMAAPSLKLTLPPSMHDRLPVNSDPYRFDPRNKMNTRIADDQTLRSLCSDTGCLFAMDSTTAVHLMGRPTEPRNYAYHIPISVFDQFRGGSTVRMCFLGKPRPQSGISSLTLLNMVAKYRIKSTFTQKDTEVHSKAGTSRDTVATGTGKDTVAPSEDTVAKTSNEGGGSGLSLLDNLLGSMASTVPSSYSLGLKAAPVKASPTSHSYGLYIVPSYTQPETKVIIRSSSSLHHEASGGTEYSLNVKVELAPEAGVTRETYEQMLWTSMKTIFKGAVNSATIHMHPYMKDALQISHSRAIPQPTQHNEELHPLVGTRTNHFSRLLRELSQLETGEYLLQVTPGSEEMTVFRENSSGTELFFNKAPKRIHGNNIKPLDAFTSIDDKRVLHWQVMQGRAPLSLWPTGHHMLKTFENEMGKERNKGGGKKRPHQQMKKGSPIKKSNMSEEEKKRCNYERNQQRKAAKQRKLNQAERAKDGGE
ncbi:hypothetical protein PENTCL1PPCAC_18858 [Pristionchus entomophagus]|uniref:Little elongation complex subunit 2 C-terminal domain-containing protein n=1 Tax=Pristionchus entomophagus TaxID=358040 RepID=A0AAV5TR10_9BILA|nr:hypothetical protein PENTCL1PPCAC_18858 [Pristionchus entomophagus]